MSANKEVVIPITISAVPGAVLPVVSGATIGNLPASATVRERYTGGVFDALILNMKDTPVGVYTGNIRAVKNGIARNAAITITVVKLEIIFINGSTINVKAGETATGTFTGKLVDGQLPNVRFTDGLIGDAPVSNTQIANGFGTFTIATKSTTGKMAWTGLVSLSLGDAEGVQSYTVNVT